MRDAQKMTLRFLFVLSAALMSMPAAAGGQPTYESLWREATTDPGCTPTDYPDLVLVTCKARLMLWYFTKPNHPAHPGVIQRIITQQADGTWVAQEHGSSFGPESAQPAFKAWLAQIADLDRQMRESIKRQDGTTAPDSN
jgi:hypothetical protein